MQHRTQKKQIVKKTGGSFEPLDNLVMQASPLKSSFLPLFILIIWIIAAVLSVQHLVFADAGMIMKNAYIGWFGWVLVLSTVFFIGRQYLKEVVLLFLLIFFLSLFLGAYLEPPSDPLEHLRRIYSYCDATTIDIPRHNKGFWQYNMSGVFLCNDVLTHSPSLRLMTINVVSATVQGLLFVGLFMLAKSSGLPAMWAFFAALTGYLFFGTDRFSYFSYYALAAGAFSMLLYWLWGAYFFFNKERKSLLWGLVFLMLVLPILLVNHQQEAAFLGFVTVFWLFWHGHQWAWKRLSDLSWARTLYLIGLVFLLLVVPQYPGLMDPDVMDPDIVGSTVAELSHNWKTNQYLLKDFIPYYPLGDFQGHRVASTLGVLGYLPLILLPFLLLPNVVPLPLYARMGIAILGLLPLIIFAIPLLSFIWISSIKASEAYYIFWRITYTAFYWLPLAAFLYGLGDKLIHAKWIARLRIGISSAQYIWLFVCILGIFLVGSLARPPVYGKLNFMQIDSQSWWPDWRPMIEKVLEQERPIYSDPLTSMLIYDAFNHPSMHTQLYAESYRPMRMAPLSIAIEDMLTDKKSFCVINLKGFTPSWVPELTGHWVNDVAETAKFYSWRGKAVDASFDSDAVKDCLVFR
jgi:hypothetical protein